MKMKVKQRFSQDREPEMATWDKIARAVLDSEAQAIAAAANRLNGAISKAVELILNHPAKVVVSGVGKSGHIGQKIAATLASTGTPAVFLHAAEAAHGDLGIYTPGNPSILISKSGATAELLRLLPVLRQFQSSLIAIVGNLNSPLAQQADVVLDARVEREADPLNLAPTCSTTVALALGDALAVALMQARQFTDKDFARFHPAGQLGRNLWLALLLALAGLLDTDLVALRVDEGRDDSHHLAHVGRRHHDPPAGFLDPLRHAMDVAHRAQVDPGSFRRARLVVGAYDEVEGHRTHVRRWDGHQAVLGMAAAVLFAARRRRTSWPGPCP